MKFVFQNAIKSIKKRKSLFLIILSLFTAYLFFFLICCYIEDGFNGISSFKVNEEENCLIFMGQVDMMRSAEEKRLSQEMRDGFFAKYDFIEDMSSLEYAYYENPLTGRGSSYYLIDDNYTKFFNPVIASGRYFSEEEILTGEKVCIITEGIRDSSGLNVGDYCTIWENKLQIIGIRKDVANNGIVLIPYETLGHDAVTGQNIQRYHCFLHLSDVEEGVKINWNDLGLIGQPITGKEFFESGKQMLLSRSSVAFSIGLIILLYTLLNLVNILASQMNQQRKKLAICIALGASHNQIFLQFFIEICIYVFSSVSLVFCCEPFIVSITRGVINHFFGPYTFFIMVSVSFISAFMISKILFSKFRRTNIVEAIKGI